MYGWQKIMTELKQRILQAETYLLNGLSYKNALSEVDVEQALKLLAQYIKEEQNAKGYKTEQVQSTNLVSQQTNPHRSIHNSRRSKQSKANSTTMATKEI